MSAIAGIWRFDGRPGPEADCRRMLAAQEIYGPHEGGLWSAGPLALGRRLFRTLPEDIHDRQPLRSRDGRLALAADIRIDNRDELSGALGLTAANTIKLCDASILMASLERWGLGTLDRLVGDFAFVLWDEHARALTLARDFNGQRPLHYHRGRDFFAFASMPKGLHALAEIPRAPDERTIAEFVALIPQNTSRTYFAGIERVMPAQVVTVTRDGLSSRLYWNPQQPDAAGAVAGDFVEGFRHHLDQATQARLRGGGGRVGAHLSAGFDSSAVTATAARLLAQSGGKIIAYTAVPREGYADTDRSGRLVDEGPLAAETAALYPNIEHILIRSGHLSQVAGLDRSYFLCDRPILNPSNSVWVQAINDAARDRKLTVMLTGQAGNMTFSYRGFELLPELLRSGRLFSYWRKAAAFAANTGMSRRSTFAAAIGPFLPLGFWQWAKRTFSNDPRNVLTYTAIRPESLAAFDLAALSRERGVDTTFRRGRSGYDRRLQGLRRQDIGNHNKGTLGGWGLDHRDPTADKRLVEYCLRIPTGHFMVGGVQRAFARTALADRLPAAVLQRSGIAYQAADWHEGLTAARGDVADAVAEIAGCASAAKILDIERMRRMVQDWPGSGWERGDVVKHYRLALLRGISAGHFLRKASGGN